MVHSRSRSRSPPRRRREPDREDRDLYSRRDGKERDRRRREDDRFAGGHRTGERDTGRRPYSRERYRDTKQDDSRQPGRSRNDQRNPSRSRSPSTAPAENKGKPNFKPSGLLAAETNSVKKTDGTSVVLKYNEPPEARRPTQSWRLYVFKGKEQLDPLHIYRQSAYLLGRDQVVCDIPIEHPSCSKQHAVIQYRHIPEKDELGNVKATVKPFIIDLESTNGTFVNDEQIPLARYYELKTGDVIKFGLSTKEYVLLHEDL